MYGQAAAVKRTEPGTMRPKGMAISPHPTERRIRPRIATSRRSSELPRSSVFINAPLRTSMTRSTTSCHNPGNDAVYFLPGRLLVWLQIPSRVLLDRYIRGHPAEHRVGRVAQFPL